MCKTQLWNDMSKKIEPLKELHIIAKTRNKIDNEPVDFIFGVCRKLKRKLIDYLFTLLEEVNVSLGNSTLFT